MISSIALAAAEGVEPKEKPRRIDMIAEDSQRPEPDIALPAKTREAMRRQRAASSPHAPRGPPDDLEERIGNKNLYSVADLARLADRSPATIFRLLRLRLIGFVQVGGQRRFTRAIVLDFLRNGTRRSDGA